ncbi:PREDICTED: uncharacterized protein LOC104944096 [Xyrichtys novacula]|uniref:PREDICTED: uncharacterized protein LOC104944096 n=1 Tax=Xyrichtys novacula TaxID=13765 RepID=A0AAV1FKW2_XYRNO|nr:PREDICTED: uncharacterized protein LOC104944096 [Xyrichtys novacula]
MAVVECSAPDCAFKTDDVSEALAIALLTNHGLAHQRAPYVATDPMLAPAPQGPNLDCPRVDVGVSIEEWNVFIRRWEVFRSRSGIGNAQAPFQLFQCAGPELGDSLLKANATVASGSLPDLITAVGFMTRTYAGRCWGPLTF